MVCSLGIVEMLVGGFAQEPIPTIDVRPRVAGTRVFALAVISSLPMLVSLLVAGDVEATGK